MRIALGIEYDGSHYNGWQIQQDGLGVQEVVERALGKVADQPVRVICAGRTDAGVHAWQQVVHFDTTSVREMRGWVFGANANLPHNVCVVWARPVSDDFHARFSAQSRCYEYRILNRPIRPAVEDRRVTWEFRHLDAGRMHAAGQLLVGEHDFTSYRAVQCQAKSPMRNLIRLSVRREGQYIMLEVEANAFLHHMVRNIAGVLMAIGAGEKPVEWSHDVLLSRDRTLGGVTAPAAGLYFKAVRYPGEFGIPPTQQEMTTMFGGRD